jgi:multidrug efflux pump subunit AcrB
MLANLFDKVTRLSLRFRWGTIVLTVVVAVLGIFGLTQLNMELLPPIDFPAMVAVTLWQGAGAEEVLNDVTIPLEDALKDVEGIVNVESNTGQGFSAISLLSEFGLDQEVLKQEVTVALQSVSLPEGVEPPELLSFSLGDIPVVVASASSGSLSLQELKELVESEILPELESIPGVESVAVSGGQELPTEPPSTEPPTPTPIPTNTPTPSPTSSPTASPTPSPTATVTEMAEPTSEAVEIEPWPEVKPLPLPVEWVEGAAAMGITMETTADITPEMMGMLAQVQPQGLVVLTWEMWQALPPEVLAAVPDSALGFVDPEIAEDVAELIGQAQAYVVAVEAESIEPEAGETATPEPTPDPERLPAFWRAAGKQMGLELERASDVTVDVLQSVVGVAPELLDTLTPEHLKALSPEVLAWLPAEFIEKLPADLRAELEALAAPAGGLGAAAKQEAEEAARLSAEAPPLPESWQQPPETGSPMELQFATAADLLKNPFGVGAAELLNLMIEMGAVPNAPELMAELTPDVILWLAEQDPEFLPGLSPGTLRLLSPEVLAALPKDFVATLDPALREELEGIAAGTVMVFVPENMINRTNGNPSLSLVLFKGGGENTVVVSHAIFDRLDELERDYGDVHFEVAFEQSSFIEESISGVSREGVLGAIFAVLVILIFLSGFVHGKYVLSWRSTLVAGVSIPLSVLAGFAIMYFVPLLHGPFNSLAETTANIPVVDTLTLLLARLFPATVTLNIMTLSGMTVAVGRVVDDSIVVLENIYRRIQRGDDRYEAIVSGTRDVAIAIFASTVTTVIVFLPLGLIGGLVGEFFMPFGLTVTYALMSSFVVAITVVPVLAHLFIHKEHMPEAGETWMQRAYVPLLRLALDHRFWTLVVATLLFLGSLWLMGQRPQAFIPALGEPSVSVTVDLPEEFTMAETDALVRELEVYLKTLEGVEVYETEIGSTSGMSMEAFFRSGVDQSAANITIAPESKLALEELVPEVRAKAEVIFGPENVIVSAADLTSSGFGGFSLVLSGEPGDLEAIDAEVIATLEGVKGLTNVSSNLTAGEIIIRVDGKRAVSYSAELETRDTMGVTSQAKAKVAALELPGDIEISEGFQTREQTKGFADMGRALIISIIAVYVVMALTFRSLIHPFTILFSLPLAVVGASLGLALTDRVLGISAMIGMMMLVGVVVTNAIVLLERVQQNRRFGFTAREALAEAGRTRLRPIWMTALAAILALLPLAMGFTEGALIAAELATVVIGGLFVSTFLTLIIVPVAYSFFDQVGGWFSARLRRKE